VIVVEEEVIDVSADQENLDSKREREREREAGGQHRQLLCGPAEVVVVVSKRGGGEE
jgi:hypothetical protein